MSKLYIDEKTVTKKIVYTIPFKAIFYDLDGTLTGLGPNTWATHNYKHLEVLPECTLSEPHEGVICDSSQRLRRITFFHQVPFDPFFEQSLFILPYDDSIIGGMTEDELTAYKENFDNHAEIAFTKMGDPGKSTVPALLTGHKYKIHWGIGIDFEDIEIMPSQNFEPDDDPIYLVHNFTDKRVLLDVTIKDLVSEDNDIKVDNVTIPDNWLADG